MKKATFFLFTIIYLYASAIASDHKKLSQFTGDFNGDGYIDLVIASGTNNRDFFGLIKVFFGTTNGINSTAGWTYNCDLSNYLQSKFFVNVIDDVNGDGTDELCLLLTNLKNGKSGRSHQDIFLFYGKKEGLENNPEILKIETDDKDKNSIRDCVGFDYDGDGYTDILAESSKRNYQPLESGWIDTEKKLLLFRGSKSGIQKTSIVIRDMDDIVFKSDGDFNNDGIKDLLIGEPSPKGVIWTQYFGGKSNTPVSKTFLKLILPKALSNDRTFNNIAYDYNGDGFDDDCIMYIDAPSFWSSKKTDSTINTFEFYPGSSDGLKDSASYKWSYKTERGTILNVTACSDLNNDGFADFVLQHFISRPKETTIMEANILWGTKEGLHLDTSNTFDKLFHSIYSVNYGFTTVIALGDVNNDGCADILLGLETIAYGNKEGNFTKMRLEFLD